jgi:DHA2 family multidrug resistance protein-like MFS transporter
VKAGRREWIGLAVLALPTMLVTMDLSVLFLAVPKLTRDLRPTSAELLWITDIYGFLIAASLITMGTLGDRVGRRRVLLAGGALFATASLIAAFSSTPAMLIGARALLGVAAATLAPSSLALISGMFRDPDQRQFAISIWISCFAVGAALGPVIAGALLQHFWWGSVFLINVPVMALLLCLGPVLLPETRDPNPGRLDLTSVALSLAALLGVIYGLTRTSEQGLDTFTILAIGVGALLGFAFVRRQRSLSYPLVDLRLFASSALVVALVAMLVSVFLVSGADLFIAQYLQLVHGSAPFTTGLLLLPGVLAILAGSMLAPALASRLGAGTVVAAGLSAATLGLLLLALVNAESGVGLVIAGATLIGFGVGPIGVLGTDLVIAGAPAERAGAASALSETATELGGALGIAVLGAIGTIVYRATVPDRLPAQLPAHTEAAAKDTLGGAAEEAAHLPAELGNQVLGAARVAFAHGFEAASIAGALVGAATALLAARELRSVRTVQSDASQPARDEE